MEFINRMRYKLTNMVIYKVKYQCSSYFKKVVDIIMTDDIDERHIIIMLSDMCKLLDQKDYEIQKLKNEQVVKVKIEF